MPREGGFTNADIDVRYYADPKLKRLWHILQNPGLMGQAVALHQATILESWASGIRVTVDAAAPMWLVPSDDLVGPLITTGLLARDRKLPAKSWSSWFQPAVSRRKVAQLKGAAGGLKKAANRVAQLQPEVSSATAQLEPSSSPALPVRQTDRPSDKQTSPTVENDGRTPTPLLGGRPRIVGAGSRP